MNSLFGKEPVSLPHLRMVKRLAELLDPLGEGARLPEEYHEAWAGHFKSEGVTKEEAEKIGQWYIKHHTICPSIPGVFTALRFLREHKTLPNQRLAGPTEVLAGELLQFLRKRGVDLHEGVRALAQASALAQVASYRTVSPSTDRSYVKSELEGVARLADFFADDILNEVHRGVGSLAHLQDYLFDDV
jgi:hypothetical protein